MITINLQQKSVLLQRIFKNCASPRIYFRRSIPRGASLSLLLSLFPFNQATGSKTCRLTYHMFQSCEPRTCNLFVTCYSHPFAIRSNATQKNAQSMSFPSFKHRSQSYTALTAVSVHRDKRKFYRRSIVASIPPLPQLSKPNSKMIQPANRGDAPSGFSLKSNRVPISDERSTIHICRLPAN